MIKQKYIFLLILFCTSCGKVEQLDTSKLKEIMKQSKVRKISADEIIFVVEKEAKSQEIEIVRLLKQNKCDSLTAFALNYLDLSKEVNSPFDKQDQVLNAYKHQFLEKETLNSNLQQANDSIYFYTFPVDAVDSECLGSVQLIEIQLLKADVVRTIVSNKKK